ncbi:WD40/YVTN/BNR-like repeat-containing protein [Leeuwenhoekiella sp. A16]|uniref:WD40/YVTN/BNR-like repeat-containing protein n=1 Tax=Leeuwenhoekiella sp. A16 TaxID=3141462 RepID=UPI003A7FDD73
MKQYLHRLSTFVFFAFITFPGFSQIANDMLPSSAEEIKNAISQKQDLAAQSLVKNVPFKNIGPTIMSGRVVDVEVNPENSTDFYVGYATGGVWHTQNNGITFTSVFDSAPTQNVGDIEIDWKTGTIWVGTGETISSRSSYAGVGLLKSTDGGKTWENTGLTDGHHISDIVINPENSDEVVVGVLGHLYSDNADRGIYKTTDGGKTWQKTLFIAPNTGIISLAAAPENPEIMYAAAWERERKAWDFKGSGEASGIYKSIDGGDSWTLITTGNGFPQGEGVGRIGLAVVDENTVYAVHDSQFRREKEEEGEKKKDVLKSGDFQLMTEKEFLDLDEEQLNDYLRSNRFPNQYDAKKAKDLVKKNEYKPSDFYLFVTDINAVEEDSEVIGAEVYLTEDGGKSWKKTHEGYIDDLFYSYGYVFAEISVNPQDKNEIYLVGVPLVKSEDGGKTFTYINEPNVHVDHHVLWIDPKMPDHVINGNDGGLNISYDAGKSWIKNNSMPLGQFYAIDVDYQEPYNVYGGLQDNGTWMGPHTYEYSKEWEAEGQYPYKSISGGDGMQVEIDRRNPDIVYAGSQFGYYSRVNVKTGERNFVRPSHSLGESPYRFNWQTPILLSPHNQDILYMGANKLMRSMNKGDDWTAISPDLTTGGKKGNVPFGTLTTVSESPFQFGLIYTGSDDGLVYLTKDTGGSWSEISQKLPQDLWVSRVVASQHKKERVYVTLNGYRDDNFQPYVFMSDDYGTTWKDISSNLPLAAVNVIVEDPVKEDYLYVGTDDGIYISMDRGASWQIFDGGLPKVPVHDVVVQTKENDLVVGTHGRSIYIADLVPLQKFDAGKKSDLQVFDIDPVNFSSRWGVSYSKWSSINEPKVKIAFYSPLTGKTTIQVLSEKGKELKTIDVEADKGFNYKEYDLTIPEQGKKDLEKEKDIKIEKTDNDNFYLPAGKYVIKVTSGGKSAQTELEVKEARRGQREIPSPEEG